MPQVTVIVPVYKVEPYLRRCVDSILAQTFSDFELVLVDDGSPDSCGAICDEYAQRDTRVIVLHRENGGLSAARNTGLDWAFANSGSQWLTFIDSDDWVHPRYLERLHQAAVSTNTALSVVTYKRTDKDSEPHAQLSEELKAEVWSGKQCIQRNETIGTAVWRRLYRKELFRGLRFPVGRSHEDEFVTYRLLYMAGQVAWLEEPLYYYYTRPGSIMNSAMTVKKLVDLVDALEERIRFFEDRQEGALAAEAKMTKQLAQAKGVIRLIAAGQKHSIPREYALGEWAAYRMIYRNASNENFCWHLSLLHPRWEKPHMYLRKLKKMLGINCP